MALVIARVLDTDFTLGNLRGALKDITLDTSYPTGGYALTGAALIGAGITLLGMQFMGGNDASGTYQYSFDNVNRKLMVFRSAGFTPAGTIGGNVTVVGGGIGEATGINPDSNAGVLSKAAATNRTIPLATYLGAAPTFTGTAVAAGGLAQVANAVNLSTVKIRVLAIGR